MCVCVRVVPLIAVLHARLASECGFCVFVRAKSGSLSLRPASRPPTHSSIHPPIHLPIHPSYPAHPIPPIPSHPLQFRPHVASVGRGHADVSVHSGRPQRRRLWARHSPGRIAARFRVRFRLSAFLDTFCAECLSHRYWSCVRSLETRSKQCSLPFLFCPFCTFILRLDVWVSRTHFFALHAQSISYFPLFILRLPISSRRCLSVSPPPSRRSSDLGGTVRLWDLRSGRRVLDMQRHIKQVNAIDFHPNGCVCV